MGAAAATRTSIHLYSWFIEPIRTPTSKRWNGNVRVWGLQTPSADKWWRSSSVAIRISSTQLVTRFGTNVFLHGTLCEKFASRVHMNSVGVDMFRNGFPPSWKQSLRSCFSNFTALRWTRPAENTRRVNNAVSILKKPSQQQQSGKRKRVRFDFNLRPIDVPSPQPKRPRLSYARAADHHVEQSPPTLVRTQSHPARSAATPAPNIRTRSRSRIVPHQPHATTKRENNVNKPNPSKGNSRASNKRNASGPATNKSNANSNSRLRRGSSQKRKSFPKSKPYSHDPARRNATPRNSSSTLIAIPIANSSDILGIRRSHRLDAKATQANTTSASQTSPSRRKRSSSVPAKPSESKNRRTRRSSSVAFERLRGPARDEALPKGRRARRLSIISEHKNDQKILERTSSLAGTTSSRVVTNGSKIMQRTSCEAMQSKVNATSEAKPSLELRRSRRLSGQPPLQGGKPQARTSLESNSKDDVVTPVSRRSKRILDRRSRHDPEQGDETKANENEAVATTRPFARGLNDVLETEGHLEKNTCGPREHDQRRSKKRRTKRGRPRGSKTKQSSEPLGPKAPGTREKEANRVQTLTRRSNRLRVSKEDTERLQTEAPNAKKQGVTDPASSRNDVHAGAGKQTKYTKKAESKTCAKSVELKSCKSSAVRFAEKDRPMLRPRKRVSFDVEVKSHDAVCVPEEGPAGSWSTKQREDFERQRNNVPANDPNYWELIALGVEGKTAAQCLELWESSWSSPPSTKRKKVGFADVENETRMKRPKISTPQAIQNVQKASKSKRGRNTAKYRTSVRRLADTFARDTEDDALEPKIVTPKMSWKLTSGTANMPSLEDGTPGTEVRQRRRNAEKGGELATPEILKRGKSFGLKEADLYVSLFRRRLGAEPIVPTSKQAKPGVKRNLAKKPPANVAQAYEPTWYGDGASLSDAEGSHNSDSSCDGDLFF